MAYVDWMIRGPKLGACSCSYGCPCEFNARPTHGMCEGLEAHRIDEGWFGATRLDGLVIGARYRWPGAVHEGGGVVQGFIDARATPAQREALLPSWAARSRSRPRSSTSTARRSPRSSTPSSPTWSSRGTWSAAPGSFVVPGVLECRLEPIRNPVTGAPHRARIVLPEGFEFRVGEAASADFTAHGAELAMQRSKSFGVLCHVAYGPYGIIEDKGLAHEIVEDRRPRVPSEYGTGASRVRGAIPATCTIRTRISAGST